MNTSFANQSAQLNQISQHERNARIELAGAYRIFEYMGWAELIFAHLSLRVPGENNYLINPYGLLYDEVTASNLVKIDSFGNIVGDSNYPFNPAGFITHSAFHENMKNINCVFHAHTTAGIAVASTRKGLDMNNIYSAQLHDRIAYHDFEGLTIYPDEQKRLLKNVGNKSAVIMRNHGVFALGESVIDAFNIMWLLNRACEIQISAFSCGEKIELNNEIKQKCSRDSFHFNPEYGAGKDVYNALLRRIDKIDPSYKY